MIEQAIASEYKKQEMRCPVHLSIGQEAPAVGVCAALTVDDKMVSTHRGHAHYLAKGGSLKGLIGELYGKSTGCSKGNGGSMHLIDLDCGFYGSTSIVAGTVPVGVGISFADKLQGKTNWTVICIGDAVVEQGVFHEAANFASLHKLKVLFLCENNKYSCFTNIKERQPERGPNGRFNETHFQAIAAAHGLNYKTVHQAPEAIVYETKALLGLGRPAFLEVPTYRYVEHCGPDSDDNLNYRDPYEVKQWLRMDQVNAFNYKPDLEKIELEIKEAFEHAKAAPYPDASEIGRYIYADN